MLTPEYIAGFFDGEGCISGSIGQSGSLSVTITQRKPEILHMLIQQFPAKYGVFPKPGLKRMCYRVYWNPVEAKPLLEAILPYVVIKKAQVEIALKFIETVVGRGGDLGLGVKCSRIHLVRQLHKFNDAISRRRA